MQDVTAILQALVLWAVACSPCLAILLALLLQKEDRSMSREPEAPPVAAAPKLTPALRARRLLSLSAFRHTA